jgi:hypothetical protein
MTMAIEAKAEHEVAAKEERPFAHLRATPEERARVLAMAPAFDAEAWRRNTVPPTPEELADLEEFLREREEMRQQSLTYIEKRIAELGE